MTPNEITEQWSDIIKFNWQVLSTLEQQTPELCRIAIKQNYRALSLVKNKTYELCLYAVQQNGNALYCITNQTPKLCTIAVTNHGNAIRYVKEPTPTMYTIAVKQNWKALKHIKDRTLELCMLAIHQDIKAFQLITNKQLIEAVSIESKLQGIELEPNSLDGLYRKHSKSPKKSFDWRSQERTNSKKYIKANKKVVEATGLTIDEYMTQRKSFDWRSQEITIEPSEQQYINRNKIIAEAETSSGYQQRKGTLHHRKSGYQPRSYQPKSGGYQPRQGGYQPKSGGYQQLVSAYRQNRINMRIKITNLPNQITNNILRLVLENIIKNSPGYIPNRQMLYTILHNNVAEVTVTKKEYISIIINNINGHTLLGNILSATLG